MFGFSRNKKQKLEVQYKQLLEESYRLSHSNRKKSDEVLARAEEIRKQIDRLESASE